MSLYRAIEYRSGVGIQYFLDLVWYLVQFSVLRAAYQFVPDVGGYKLGDMYLFLAFLFTIDAFNMIFFQEGIELFIRSIRNGALDFFLLRPFSALFQLSLSRVSLTGLMNIFFSLGFWIYVLVAFEFEYPWHQWVWAILVFLNGVVLNLIFRLCIACVSFWTVDGRSLGWLFHELLRFGSKPEAIYNNALRFVLVTFVPVLLFSSWACYVLIRETSLFDKLFPFGMTALCSGLLLLLWRFGVRRYEGLSF